MVLYPDGPEPSSDTWAHEHGHQEQSGFLGPLYLPETIVGYAEATVISLYDTAMGHPDSNDIHDGSFMEQDADRRSGRRRNIERNKFLR